MTQREPYAKGLAPPLSTNRHRITDEQLRVASRLQRLNIPYVIEKAFATRETVRGHPLIYSVDLVIGDNDLGVEIFGDGTSCDDSKRDAFLKTNLKRMLYLPNKFVNASPTLAARLVQLEWNEVLGLIVGTNHPETLFK